MCSLCARTQLIHLKWKWETSTPTTTIPSPPATRLIYIPCSVQVSLFICNSSSCPPSSSPCHAHVYSWSLWNGEWERDSERDYLSIYLCLSLFVWPYKTYKHVFLNICIHISRSRSTHYAGKQDGDCTKAATKQIVLLNHIGTS